MGPISPVNPAPDGHNDNSPPPPFLPQMAMSMGLAQLQAMGLLGYLPQPPTGAGFPSPPLGLFPQGPGLFPGLPPLPGLPVPPAATLPQESDRPTSAPPPETVPMDTDETPEDLSTTRGTKPSPSASEPSPGSPDNDLGDECLEDSADNRKPIQERIRQKRQTIQDMTRPLKQWLYGHRDNPYPSKSDKLQLARESRMTMTQVSNWFANARRRLKNTVRGSEMTWAKRIKLYNNYVEGNQELLSVGSSSDDDILGRHSPLSGNTDPEDDQDQRLQGNGESPPSASSPGVQPGTPVEPHSHGHERLSDGDMMPQLSPQGHNLHNTPQQQHAPDTTTQAPNITMETTESQPHPTQARVPSLASPGAPMDPTPQAQEVSPDSHGQLDSAESPSKYKHTIMQRYLNDSYTYQNALQAVTSPERDPKEKERHRNPSGSLSSHDYEEYMSSASSSRSTPTREHMEGRYDQYEQFSRHWPDIENRAEDDLYWKEISAALALTSLARAKYNTAQAH